MIVYLILFFIAFILIFIEDNRRSFLLYSNYGDLDSNKKSFLIVLFLTLLVITSGTRYKLGGTDYDAYEYLYENVSNAENLPDAITVGYEIGYTAFIYICSHYLNLTYNGCLLLEAGFFYIVLYYGLKRYIPNWGIFFVFFMYKMFFYQTFISMRQSLTVCLFFVIIRFIEERKVYLYYISLLLISLFHNGAVLLAVLYPIYTFKLSQRMLIKIGAVFALTIPFAGLTGNLFSYVISLIDAHTLEEKAVSYSNNEEYLNILYAAEYYILYYIFVKNYNIITKKFKHAHVISWLFISALPIITLFRSSPILVRELPYFYPAYAIIFSYICLVNSSKKNQYIIIFSLLCFLGMLKFIIQFDDGGMMPYVSWIFNDNIHVFQR